MAKSTTDLSYCGREVRKYDNDHFLAGLFAPADRREPLFALHAFNLEIAKTREVVSEPILGQMRLQFWRDGIEAVYGDGPVPRHEVMDPLAQAAKSLGLSRALFDRLIDAREADLDDTPPADLTCLVNYAEVTGAPLVQLALEILGVRDEATHAAGRHVGIAYALTGILRAVPFLARQHRQLLPADLMAKHGARSEDLFELRSTPELRPVIGDVALVVRKHLREARALRRSVPRAALPALLPAVLAELHLAVVAREGNDVFAPRVLLPNPFRQLRLGWAALRGRY
ncbi:phytoene/squalene synthase family protein [Azospirillum doebereinerae]|uniref:phytoene/squalene synthase family protein n=1 Tax=Azospirillum doebereinerae TaxID=92933 RepID=UPI001EE5207D|nr:phytoene/squalene synthase family protein [Azospirillum doebereinerae]MCG5242619.1 squalene/phytoene synthase family protein [Azospirillum doebereinerae]